MKSAKYTSASLGSINTAPSPSPDASISTVDSVAARFSPPVITAKFC